MSIKAVIFDMDGVLIDSESAIEESFRQVLKEQSDFDLTPEIYKEIFLGVTDKEGLENFKNKYPEVDISNFDVEKAGHYSEQMGINIRPYPGALEAVKQAAEKYVTTLATSSQMWQLDEVQKIFPVKDLFSIITTADEIEYSKPNPEMYQLAVKKLGLKPEECLAIEDSIAGVKSAKTAGLQCWAIAHTVPKDELGLADKVFNNISEIKF